MSASQFLEEAFRPVSLAELGGAGLMERTELKFLLPQTALLPLLQGLAPRHRCLKIGTVMEQSYTTHYFDTEGLQLYLDHHNGYLRRWKVRCRRYDDTGDCFFEIKERYNELQTGKRRVPIDLLPDRLPASLQRQLDHRHLRGEVVGLRLINRFQRITCVDAGFRERITIDTGISMQHENRRCSFPKMVLAEVKQARPDRSSEAMLALRRLGAVQASFSKYALGMVLLRPGTKYNTFKPLLLQLQKLIYARPECS